MISILTGIYSRYNSSAALKAALPGKLHFQLAPQSTAMTYATYNVISNRPEYMFDGTQYEIFSIQFDIYAVSNALRLAAYEALSDLYDDSKPIAIGETYILTTEAVGTRVTEAGDIRVTEIWYDYSAIIMERTLEQFVRDGEQDELRRAVVSYDARYLKA